MTRKNVYPLLLILFTIGGLIQPKYMDNIYLILFFLFLIGVPHGAFDILRLKNRFSKKYFLVSMFVYVLLASLAYVFWDTNNNLFFYFFWLISLIHFFDVERSFSKKGKLPFYDLMFFSLFTLPLLKLDNFKMALTFLNNLVFFKSFERYSNLIILIQILTSTFVVCLMLLRKRFDSYYFIHWINVALLSYYSDLVTTFLYIFILCHSFRHLTLNNLKTRVSFIVVGGSFLVCILLWFASSEISFEIQNTQFLRMFVILGCLTFPHLILEVLESRVINPSKRESAQALNCD